MFPLGDRQAAKLGAAMLLPGDSKKLPGSPTLLYMFFRVSGARLEPQVILGTPSF
jgi:hypothetical protein